MTSPTIVVPEPMTRFRCNQKGCCCKGWGIGFDVRDAIALTERFPPEERMAILDGAKVRRNRDGKVTHLDLRRVGEERACQFLAGPGTCSVHAAHGPEILPQLCQSFPAFALKDEAVTELHYDAMCPEVLEQLDEGPEPLRLIEVARADNADLAARSRRPMNAPTLQLGGHAIDLAQLGAFRGQVLTHIAESTAPVLDDLWSVSVAVGAAVEAGTQTLAFPSGAASDEFHAFFDACVSAHASKVLANYIEMYRRFIWAVQLGDADFEALLEHLPFDFDWRETLDPTRSDLQPLLKRYLAHRFYNAFDRSPASGVLSFGYQATAHVLATAFRYAIAISRALNQPLDRAHLKVGIGAAEYLLRTLKLPPEAMPWFGLRPS